MTPEELRDAAIFLDDNCYPGTAAELRAHADALEQQATTHVAVRQMTLEEAKEAYREQDEVAGLSTWLAALRHVGVIEEGEKE